MPTQGKQQEQPARKESEEMKPSNLVAADNCVSSYPLVENPLGPAELPPQVPCIRLLEYALYNLYMQHTPHIQIHSGKITSNSLALHELM